MVILNQTNYFSKDRQLKMFLKLWHAYFLQNEILLISQNFMDCGLKRDLQSSIRCLNPFRIFKWPSLLYLNISWGWSVRVKALSFLRHTNGWNFLHWMRFGENLSIYRFSSFSFKICSLFVINHFPLIPIKQSKAQSTWM